MALSACRFTSTRTAGCALPDTSTLDTPCSWLRRGLSRVLARLYSSDSGSVSEVSAICSTGSSLGLALR